MIRSPGRYKVQIGDHAHRCALRPSTASASASCCRQNYAHTVRGRVRFNGQPGGSRPTRPSFRSSTAAKISRRARIRRGVAAQRARVSAPRRSGRASPARVHPRFGAHPRGIPPSRVKGGKATETEDARSCGLQANRGVTVCRGAPGTPQLLSARSKCSTLFIERARRGADPSEKNERRRSHGYPSGLIRTNCIRQ